MKQLERHIIFKRMAECNFPLRAQIEITRRCNLDCVHCMVKDIGIPASDELTLPEMKKLLSELAEAGVFHINITGGEPLARADSLEILGAIFEKNFYLTLQTNGVLLKDEHYELLKRRRKNIRQIGLSLYGTNPETHEKVTGVPGSHAATVDAILRLRADSHMVVVMTILSKINHAEFTSVENFCKEHDVMFQYNTMITPRDDGDTSALGLRLDADCLCALPKPWDAFLDTLTPGSEPLTPERPLSDWCSMASTTCYITANGDVRPCSIVTQPAGNVRALPFTEIWRESEFLNKIRSLQLKDFECCGCPQMPECHPCPGVAALENGGLTAIPKEICRINSVFSKKGGGTNE